MKEFFKSIFLWLADFYSRHKIISITALVFISIFLLFFAAYIYVSISSGGAIEEELARIRAAGEPTTIEEIIHDPIPNSENAAPLYMKAARMLEVKMVNGEYEDCFRDYSWSVNIREGDELPEGEDPVEARKKLAAILDKHKEVFEIIEAASKKEKCHFPLKWEDGMNMLCRGVLDLVDLTRFLIADAGLKLEKGEYEAALKNCRIALRIVSHSFDDGMLIQYCGGLATLSLSLDELELIIDKNDASEKTLMDLISELERIKMRPLLVRALKADRPFYIDLFKELIATGMYKDKEVSPEHMEFVAEGYRGSSLFKWFAPPIFKINFPVFLRYMRELISIADQPYYKIADKHRQLSEKIKSLAVYYMSVKTIMPSMCDKIKDNAEAEAKIDLARLALALKIYQKRNGSYPDKLEALAPGILAEVPKDPYTGNDFVYKKEKDGFVLYSLAENQIDDGGVPEGKNEEPGQYDIVWRAGK